MIGLVFSGYEFIRMYNTRRGRSRARHVRDREADIERAKNCGLGHSRRLKGEARRAKTTTGLCFRGKAPKVANGEARRAKLNFGVGFFGAEGPKGEARRAEPTSPFS